MATALRSSNQRTLLLALTAIWLVALVISGWQPYDRATWWMEVVPVLIALPVLWLSASHFSPTSMAIVLIAFHGLVLILGGAFTYARVPLGLAVQDWLELSRNPYDRFGHFVQGFVPAIVLRELLIRLGHLTPGKLVAGLVIASCLAVSAAYELIEFAVAMLLGQDADEFLGTQGDAWDTQWDMLMCLVGAGAALLLLTGLQNRQLQALGHT